MPGARSRSMVMFGLLFPAAVVADDAEVADADNPALPPVTLSADAYLATPGYTSWWRSTHAGGVPARADELPQPVDRFDFRDSDVIARISELRMLSLLTLAEVGTARLFFGVDDDGLVGLHFSATARQRDRQYAEIIRMPYLNADKPAVSPEPASERE